MYLARSEDMPLLSKYCVMVIKFCETNKYKIKPEMQRFY